MFYIGEIRRQKKRAIVRMGVIKVMKQKITLKTSQ